jgi:hypothetical protein
MIVFLAVGKPDVARRVSDVTRSGLGVGKDFAAGGDDRQKDAAVA